MREQQGWVAALGRMVCDKACRDSGFSCKGHPKKSKAGLVTMVCQNSPGNWASLGPCCWTEIGAQGGVQARGHQARTVPEPKRGSCWQWDSEAAAPASTAPALLPPALGWSDSGLRQDQPHSSLHRDPACLQN